MFRQARGHGEHVGIEDHVLGREALFADENLPGAVTDGVAALEAVGLVPVKGENFYKRRGYLAGTDEERAAVEAQAVAARTYAVAQLGNHAEAGFDVFGNVAHQVSTRLYMDHLRMQAELLFLSFLPAGSY